MVRLKCAKCGRWGQYRKATLIEKYGRDIPLPFNWIRSVDLLTHVNAPS